MGSRQDGKVTYRPRHSHPASRYIGTTTDVNLVVFIVGVIVVVDGDFDDDVVDDFDA